MKKYLNLLKSIPLFDEIAEENIFAVLTCLKSEIKPYRKNEIVLMAGETPKRVGLVLEGELHIVRSDYDGNDVFVATLAPGEIFSETLCCANVEESPVTVSAEENSEVLLFEFSKILHLCERRCAFHEQILKNMLRLIAEKNLYLQNRMEILSLKSIRTKVLHYLGSFAPKQGRVIFVPLNREEMANYLCVERSALSHELMKMKKDGLLAYQKNRFELF